VKNLFSSLTHSITMRIKHFILSGLFVCALLLSPRISSAQFVNGKVYLGPHIGLSAVGSSPAFGVNFEAPITQPGKVGPGMLGISARIDYWSWSYGFLTDNATYTYITVAALVNYHLLLEDKTWDPFVGLGLAYIHTSFSWPGSEAFNNIYPSYITIVGTAGVRYFFSPNFAARAMLGFGVTFVTVGVDFGL
jgi:hypothetical protein